MNMIISSFPFQKLPINQHVWGRIQNCFWVSRHREEGRHQQGSVRRVPRQACSAQREGTGNRWRKLLLKSTFSAFTSLIILVQVWSFSSHMVFRFNANRSIQNFHPLEQGGGFQALVLFLQGQLKNFFLFLFSTLNSNSFCSS